MHNDNIIMAQVAGEFTIADLEAALMGGPVPEDQLWTHACDASLV
jgi:hypothetical protein